MRTVVVTEKPSMSRAIAGVARAAIGPEDSLTIVTTLMLGAYRYAVPRHLAWTDYPVIHRPDRLVARPNHSWFPMEVHADGTFSALDSMTDGAQMIREADQMVFACDVDHTGVMGFDLSVKGALGLPVNDWSTLAPAKAWEIRALDDRSLLRAMQQPTTFGALDAYLRYGETKRYFDHQFMINSWGVLGRCQEQVGVPREPALSKYMVQLLYHIRTCEQQRIRVTEGNLHQTMNHWVGTGRYPADDHARMGSAASRASIVEHLWTLELLSSGGLSRPWPVRLSGRGQALLALLHPGCEDRDLPFRLHAWCLDGLPLAQPAIDRYVRTWFGRQKRRLDHGLGTGTPNGGDPS